MKTLTLSLSDAAASDILDQMDWYEQEADIRLGSRCERSVYLSLLRLARIHTWDRYAVLSPSSCAAFGGCLWRDFRST